MSDIAKFITELSVIIGVIVPFIVFMICLINGMKCLLRSEMLRIYYHHKDKCIIRQYELENFIYLYKAYKALKGNSFIDKVYKEIMTWSVIT